MEHEGYNRRVEPGKPVVPLGVRSSLRPLQTSGSRGVVGKLVYPVSQWLSCRCGNTRGFGKDVYSYNPDEHSGRQLNTCSSKT